MKRAFGLRDVLLDFVVPDTIPMLIGEVLDYFWLTELRELTLDG